jgi:hypothetical protein
LIGRAKQENRTDDDCPCAEGGAERRARQYRLTTRAVVLSRPTRRLFRRVHTEQASYQPGEADGGRRPSLSVEAIDAGHNFGVNTSVAPDQ